ncbi:MAG: FAD-dependent oxidoreductase [Bacteroidota bacterium]
MSTTSFWEREHLLKFDFIVIGAGIVGLTTAINLRKKYRKASIAILEKGLLPSGASTKNAGFACFGSPTELWSDLSKHKKEDVLDLVTRRWEGLRKLRELTGDHKIDYENLGGFEIIPKSIKFDKEKLDFLNELLHPIFKERVYINSNSLIDSFGINKDYVESLVKNTFEGQLNTGKLIKRLMQIVHQNDITLHSGCSVEKLEDKSSFVELLCSSDNSQHLFKANKVAVCTNGFVQKLITEIDVQPARGTVLVTKPIKNLRIKGSFHYDEGFFYFRNIENRILLGGGRKLDFENEKTTSLDINQKIFERLKSDLHDNILPNTTTEIDMVWSGIMGFSDHKRPILKTYSNNIAVGVALGGMGVAIGALVGEELAEHVIR